MGAIAAQAGERTVHSIDADKAATALVAPTEIPTKISKGRQGIIRTRGWPRPIMRSGAVSSGRNGNALR